MSELFEVVGQEAKHEQPVEVPAVVQSQDDRLLEKVLESGNIEVLERYIALRKSEQERQARLEFESHFVEMQKDYVPVYKSKTVFDENRKKMYSYTPLEDIIETYAPILRKHGFSFYWDEETLNENNKRIWCHICGYGWERKGYVDVAIQPPNKYGNAIQQRGVSTSYGQRYSFKNALGIVEKDADTDGNNYEKEAEPYVSKIMECTTMDELRQAYLKALEQTAKNKPVQGLIALAKDAKQKELRNGPKVS